MERLGDGPCDRDAVECAGAAADFVEQDEASCGGVAQDMRRLFHLDHEGRFAARQIIRRADAREDAVHETDLRLGRGHEASHLGQYDDERNLPHVGRFARHVGSREDDDLLRLGIERAIVRHERAAPEHRFDDRVPPFPDQDCEPDVDLGLD